MSAKAFNVLITDASIRPEGIEMLEAVASLTVLQSYTPEAGIIEAAREADAILARAAVISEAVIQAAPKLKIVSRHGVGVDNVDVAACTRQGVLVSITGDANSEAVSEYAFGLLLAVARKVAQANAHIRAGQWNRDLFIGLELYGKVLGIIGLGRIGSRLGRHAAGFDMEALAYDPYVDANAAQAAGIALVDLETLLRRADFISLHMPLTDETRHLIGPAELALMKSSAILVNTARGGLIDEAALYETLLNKRIAGAALDVFETEPLSQGNRLATLDNLLCSPHVAGQTQESLLRMSVDAAENILRVFRGETPLGIINPEALDQQG
ncbi:MAG TPA: hydroxyacid dehydrogenase [Anaerolineae bacterium]